MRVWEAADRLAGSLDIDEERDVVRWHGLDGRPRQTGLHDYAGLYAEQGLYEAVYFRRLRGSAPAMLARALGGVVAAEERAQRQVLDIGAGTGIVGEELHAAGFARIAGTDLEPASEPATRRDRPGVYGDFRVFDLVAPTAEDERWLTGLAPAVVTIAGAVGFGHLPAAAKASSAYGSRWCTSRVSATPS